MHQLVFEINFLIYFPSFMLISLLHVHLNSCTLVGHRFVLKFLDTSLHTHHSSLSPQKYGLKSDFKSKSGLESHKFLAEET